MFGVFGSRPFLRPALWQKRYMSSNVPKPSSLHPAYGKGLLRTEVVASPDTTAT